MPRFAGVNPDGGAIEGATYTALRLVKTYDTASMYNANGSLTIPVDGMYEFQLSTSWTVPSSRKLMAFFSVGAAVGTGVMYGANTTTLMSGSGYLHTSAVIALEAADTVWFGLFQSGADEATLRGAQANALMIGVYPTTTTLRARDLGLPIDAPEAEES